MNKTAKNWGSGFN